MVYEVNSGVYSSRAIFCTDSTKHLLSMSLRLFFFFFVIVVIIFCVYFALVWIFFFMFPCISFGPHAYKHYETRDDGALLC